MTITFKPLWKLLIDRDITREELRRQTGLSPAIIAKHRRDGNVTTDVLAGLIATLLLAFLAPHIVRLALVFGPREMRLYPNGQLASHILGGSTFGAEGVSSAEVLGMAGVEKAFDNWLRDPANAGAPLTLSIDLTAQAAMEEVLSNGMKVMNAKGATGILMDIRSGEIMAMASLPDFDPNDRPRPLLKGDPSDSPLFNRAVQGQYELGSTFKIFPVAQAIDEKLDRLER